MRRLLKHLLVLIPLVVLLSICLIIIEGPNVLHSMATAAQSPQSGLGGAYNSGQPAAGTIYGGSGPGGSCLGTSGDFATMLKFDFNWDHTRINHFVNSTWQHDTTDQLCNDHYIWQSVASLPLSQIVATLQWPSDLIQSQWATHFIALQPIQDFDPRTFQAQQNQKNGTPTPNPTPGQGKVYGGTDSGGSCIGTSGTIVTMLKFDFGWDQATLQAAVNSVWLADTRDLLCNDNYFWETVTALSAQRVIQQLQWPANLLNPQYQSQIITLKPLSTFDMKTVQAQQAAQQGSNKPTGPCDWVVHVLFTYVHIDLCAPLRLLISATNAAIRGIYQAASSQLSFLQMTPTQPFTDNAAGGLLTVWTISWSIVLACIIAVVAWSALRYMLGSTMHWLAYANLVEMIPRLLLGLLAAYYSKQFFLLLIQTNNTLAAIFECSNAAVVANCTKNTIGTTINAPTTGTVAQALQIVYGGMGFLLIIEEAARIAVIYLLFAFSPILFFLASLRETERWAKSTALAAILFILLQAMQAATLNVGEGVLSGVLHNSASQLGFLNLLVAIAILYITLLLFFSITRMAFGFAGGPLALAPVEMSMGLAGAGGRALIGSGRALGGAARWAAGRAFTRSSSKSGSSSGSGSGGQQGGPGSPGGGQQGGSGGSGGGQQGTPGGSGGGQQGSQQSGPGNPGGQQAVPQIGPFPANAPQQGVGGKGAQPARNPQTTPASSQGRTGQRGTSGRTQPLRRVNPMPPSSTSTSKATTRPAPRSIRQQPTLPDHPVAMPPSFPPSPGSVNP